MKGVFRRFINFLFRELTRYLLTFLLIASILVGSLVRPLNVYALEIGATTIGIGELAGFLGSTFGFLNVVSGNNAVTSGFSHMRDTISEWWADNQGNGIYEDTEGNLIFGEAASQDLLERLLNDSSIDARAISYFGGNNWVNAMYYANSPYINASFKAAVSTAISNYDNYLVCFGQYPVKNGYDTKAMVFDISNVAYITNYVNSFSGSGYEYCGFYFFNSSGSRLSPNCKSFTMSYSHKYGFGELLSFASSYDTVHFGFNDNRNDIHYLRSSDFSDNIATSDMIGGDNFGYLNFPFLFSEGSLFFSNRSLIIGKTIADANQLYEGGGNQYILSNYYNQISSISKDVLMNNNWENIYNSYVTNVQNNSENYVVDGQIDYEKLRQYMKQYSNVIADEVKEGTNDIEQKVNYTNEWLDRIYRMLGEIRDILNSDGGDASVDLTAIENYLNSINTNTTSVLSALTRIENSLAGEYEQMELEYALLQNIYTALQNIGSGGGSSGGGGGGSGGDWDKWFDILDDMPDPDVLDIIGKGEVITQLLQGVVPFCYIVGFGALINSLGVEPQTPDFDIPFKLTSLMQVEENVSIDLSGFNDIRPIVIGFECILFMVGLAFLTVWLLKFLLDIIGG